MPRGTPNCRAKFSQRRRRLRGRHGHLNYCFALAVSRNMANHRRSRVDPRNDRSALMPIGLSETPNEQEGIGRFETTEEEKPERIRRLVKARLTAFENAPGRRFRLRFTLACGPG